MQLNFAQHCLLIVRTLIEKATEYNLPLYLIFIDYKKAFDSIKMWAVQRTLNNSKVDYRYTELITSIYNEAQTVVEAHSTTNSIPVQRGVRHGDSMSPKLFNAALEEMFKDLNWENTGININGQRLNHLRYADYVLLISNNFEEIQVMLKELTLESEKVDYNLISIKLKQ